MMIERRKMNESGITLQTLVITAVLVTIAVVASAAFWAIASNRSEALEDSQSDIESLCQPWEVHKATLAAKGYGGTQGYGGVFSSRIGCIAVCYYSKIRGFFFPNAQNVANRDGATLRSMDRAGWAPGGIRISTLEYDDSNRNPGAWEVRLGVAYNRVSPDEADDPDEFWPDFGYYRRYNQQSDSPTEILWTSRDPDPIIRMVGDSGGIYDDPPRIDWPGTPIPLEFRGETHTGRWSRGIPWSASLHVYKPNFWSPNHANFRDRDEEWEVRADPGREVCEIVDTANDDEIMLTSAREYDPSNPYPD